MEADERLRWLETRVGSSLRPRGEDLRRMVANEDNRATFLSFCNHSESRCIFVHVTRADDGDGEVIQVSSSPPNHLHDKTMVFLKCSHASKLNRENLAQDVMYTECSTSPLAHLDLVMQEVYLPLMTSPSSSSLLGNTHTSDQLLDLLHRISSSMQITHGYSQGKVILPLPSVSTLVETALTSPDRHSVVVHVLETAVVTWMKQVKMALHCDPSGTISRKCGRHAGALEEIKFWDARQRRLESVRDQLSSVPILTILHNLEVVHSSYAQGFSRAQHDIAQATREAEHCLVFLHTLRPWLLKLHNAQYPNTMISSFPPIMATLLLIWQHSGYYSQQFAFHRLLALLANEIVTKTIGIVNGDLLNDPPTSLLELKLALRVCAAFRGCYLDYKERADNWLKPKASNQPGSVVSIGEKGVPSGHTPWPLRNSKVFHSLNALMERCNDLTELVHTIHDFSELEAAGRGVGVTTSEAVIGDIYSQFTATVQVFTSSSQDLLSLSLDSHFESQFFSFRRKVQQLEKQLGQEVGVWLHQSPSLQTQLRIMQMFQCSSSREVVRTILAPHHKSVVAAILSDVEDMTHSLTTQLSHPTLFLHTPPVASKLLWLHGLGERASGAMGVVRSAAPELLEGELGWKLRHVYSELIDKLQSYRTEEERKWVNGIPHGLGQKLLTNTVLAKESSGQLMVNFDPVLHKVVSEAYHLSRPPLSMRMPPIIKLLMKGMNWIDLRNRRASLELAMQVYRDVLTGMSDEERLLLHDKLQQAEILLASGEDQVTWLSAEFPDFLAKCKAVICVDLCSSLSTLHTFTSTLCQITTAWSEVAGLDIFVGEGENTLEELSTKHSAVVERLNDLLPFAMSRIHSNLASVLSSIHASPESPAWDQYLQRVEREVTEGLVGLVLTAVGSLLHRAHLYEQGVSIPALMAVQLEMVGGVVTFSPPLTPHSSLPSIPEIVAKWMDSYVASTRHLPRVLPNSQENYQQLLTSDPQVRSALAKVSAHLETNSRQAQTLRKRFSQYCFLWEQDVQMTFRAFLKGEAPPHPQRLSRPETVRSRSSARPHSSGRPKSSQVSISQQSLQVLVPDTAGLNQVTGVSDWDFLCPPGMESGPDEDISKRPSLDEFDGELAIFQGIGERLCNMESDCNVGWLTVNQRPVKDTLITLVSKWKAVYAGYLERQISQVLNSLEVFFHEVEPEVERMGGEGNSGLSLMALMAIFNKVNTQQVEMDKKFGAVHRAFAMLDKFSHPLPRRLRDQFNTAPHRWASLKKRISLGKQRMGPYIQSQSDTISADLTEFAHRYTTLRQGFGDSECLSHECNTGQAVDIVRGVSRELGILQEEACNLIELQELLGTSVFNFSLLNEFQDELSTLSELWTLHELVMAEHSVWQQMQWKSVECQEVEGVTARQIDMVQALPSFAQQWDVHQHLLSYLLTLQLTLPLVEGLRSTAIRPRHWKQVLRYASSSSLSSSHLVSRGGGLDSSVLDSLTLSQLMALELHVHCSEVVQIVERANKEVAIEALLNTFEEVWLSRQLELVASERQPLAINRQETVSAELGLEGQTSPATPKPRVSSARVTSAVQKSQSVAKVSSPPPTSPFSPPSPPSPDNHQQPIRLLCNTDSIFETLESHQTSLQSVVGTAAAASFSDDLHRWQKQLQTIEAVLGVWLQVQALWIQLEVYRSPEVQQQLPAQSFIFTSVDKEWRELLESAVANPSVMTVCLKEGVLAQLEKLQSSLLQCRDTLVGYAEGQRAKCRWFYFIPLDDVLQFVCCGSRVDKLSSLIHKLLPHANSLLYSLSSSPALPPPSSPSHHHHPPLLPRITGVVSHRGERLELQQSVVCGGTVEGTLTSLFSSLHSTLRSQLATAVTLITESSSSSSSLSSLLPPLWGSQLSTQVILLATQLSLDTALTAALPENERGDRAQLEGLCQEIDKLQVTAAKMLQGQQLPVEERERAASNSVSDRTADMNAAYSSRTACLPATHDQASRLKSVLLILTSHRQRAMGMSREEDSNGLSFIRQSRLRWTWSEGGCYMTTLGARLSYGYHYVGSSCHMVLTPCTERALVFLLRAVHHGDNALMTGPEGGGKSSAVHELATMMGQPLFTLHCSSFTSLSTLLSCLQGMALTGCWLLLQSVDCLSLAVLHVVTVLLPRIQQARHSRVSSLPWLGEELTLSPGVTPGACFATTSFPRGSDNLPPELHQTFVSYSITPPGRRVLLEALLLAHQFESHHRHAQTLDTVFTAVDELFNSHISVVGEEENRTITVSTDIKRPVIPLSLQLLESIVLVGQQYMMEFEKCGLLQGSPLHDPSTVLSDMSEGARASFRLRAASVDQTQQPPLSRSSLEDHSILFSLKDLLLPQLHDTASLSTLIALLTDLFPGCNMAELLAGESQHREDLAAKAAEDREAGASARESRAASAMMVVREENRVPSEEMTPLEGYIVQACLLDNLVPSPAFQLAVSQLLSLIQTHSIVAVVGDSCSGKTSIINVAANTLRCQGAGLSLSWVVPGVLDEGELFGHETEGRWQEGLLPQLLYKMRSEGTPGSAAEGWGGRWMVLDGVLSPFQLDTLLTLLDTDKLIKLSNSRGIPIESNCRFILELPSLDSLTPRASSCLPRLCLSPSTITWWDPVSRWLRTQPSDVATALEPLLQRLLPLCLKFLAPVLSGAGRGGGVSVAQSASSLGAPQRVHPLSPQDLRLHPIHLVLTCCKILEAHLPSSSTLPLPELKCRLTYSLVWSLGGHLSPANKLVFDQWWRHTFTEPGLTLPSSGLLWDYYPRPDSVDFLPCSATLNLTSSPECDANSPPPFVSTSRAGAIAHLVYQLISQGYPVLLVGEPGSGKTALLQRLFCENTRNSNSSLQHFYTSQFTTGQMFWMCLKEHLEWKWGRNYAPQASKNLICFIDDLHDSAPSGNLGELLRGHMTSGGVWEAGEGHWYNVANTSYICTTHCSGDTPLDDRLAKHFIVLHWSGYEPSDLDVIFSTILSHHLTSSPSSAVRDVGRNLVCVAVQVHRQLCSLFLPALKRQHYLFNLRHIAGLFRRLCQQCGNVEEVEPRDLLVAWQRESWWTYGGFLSSEVDRERYWEVVSHALRKHFSQSDLLPELLQPSSYQLTSCQRETLRSQLQQQLSRTPGLHVHLYDNALEEIHRLCQLITSPFDLSHTLLIGHAHPDPLVELAAVQCGYTVTKPSVIFSPSLPTTSCTPFGMSPASYTEEMFRNDLCTIYTETGVKKHRLLLLVTCVEMLHESFLGLLHEATCDCYITHLFPREERTRIINAVRSEVTRAGLVFNPSTAWDFFLCRVRQNLRIVLSFPDLSQQPLSVHWRELLCRVNIHYHQPWTQRELVSVVLHHLNGTSLLSPSLSEGCSHMLAAIHLQLRDRKDLLPAYNCKFSYLAERFVHELWKNHSHLLEHMAQLRGGMECMSGARDKARQVEEKLAREERVLGEREEAYGKLLVQLGQDTAISQEHNRLVARQRQRVVDLRKVIPEYELALQMACEEKLSLVLNLKHQVMNINHSSLTELRAQQRPPQLIEDLMVAVISVIKSPTADLSWTKGAKRLMANIDRFQELLLGQSQIEDNSETILESVGPITSRVAQSVDELGTHPGGLAATQLLEWVQGVVKLHSILQTRVRPLEARLEAMSTSLKEGEEKLRQQEEKMQVLRRRVSGLSEALENAAVQCSGQSDMVKKLKNELQETHKFVEVLSASYVEWGDQLDSANHALAQGLGSLAISMSIPVYLAAVPPHTQLHIVHTVLLPLLRERGVPVVWSGEQPALSSFCDHEDDTSTTDRPYSPSSYAALCQSVLPQLAPPTFTTRWLKQAHSLPAVLGMSLAALSWRRPVLMYDPEAFASHWLREWKGEELMIVDCRERTLQFYLNIEQALLCGDPLLVEGVTMPIDPALTPLLEMVHGWSIDEPNTVRFCGRKIQASSGFTLFLSTTAPLSSFPPTLTCVVCPLDLSLSLPWGHELLFRTACGVADSPQHFDKLLCEVVSGDQEVRMLEKKLLSLLCSSKLDNCCTLTQKVADIVTASREAETSYMSHRDQLSHYIVARSPLIPLTKTASLTFDLLHKCSSQQTMIVSMGQFQQQLTTALRVEKTDGGGEEEVQVLGSLATALQATAEVLSAAEGEKEEREMREARWRVEVLQELMMTVMRDVARVLTYAECQILACALSILASIPSHHSAPLLIEQLTFLAHGRSYLQVEEEEPTPLPERPSAISRDLWAHLHCMPLSTLYFSRVTSSAHSHSDMEFWAGIKHEKGRSIAEFPWKQGRNEPDSLDDILMLNLIHEPTALQAINRDTAKLLGCMRPFPLSELLVTPEGEKRKPLLLLYDENQLACEVNLLFLQDELQNISGDETVKVMNMVAIADQGMCTCISTPPTAHCLLVTGLCHCDPNWLPLASIKMQQASENGCVVVAVVTSGSPQLTTLSRFCRATHLSHLALPFSSHLPPEATQTEGVLPSLLYLLSSLPHISRSQLSSLPTSFHPLLFHLSLLHSALHHRSKLAGRRPPSLPLFSSALSLLSSLSPDHTLPDVVETLKEHSLSVYSSHCSRPVVESLVNSCLDPSTVVPGGTLTIDMGECSSLIVVTPGPGVPLSNYGDHVAGIISSDAHKGTDVLSKDTLSAAVSDLLIPLLTKLPDDTHLPTSPNSTLTTSPLHHYHHPRHLPQPPTPSPERHRGGEERRLLGADVCSQLPSSQTYLNYLWTRAMGSLS